MLSLGTAAMAAQVVPCLCCADARASGGWSYEGEDGPSTWDANFNTGKAQSPIDLPIPPPSQAAFTPGTKLRFDYDQNLICQVTNPGHQTPVVTVPLGHYLYLGDRQLELLQYHFHTPSEHAFGGTHSSIEAHLVHRDKKRGDLLVVGVLLQRGKCESSIPLRAAIDYAPSRGLSPVSVIVNPADLLPPTQRGFYPYVSYAGSLTTPPLTEGVDWVVLRQSKPVCDVDVLDFATFAGNHRTLGCNARPFQPLNGRTLTYQPEGVSVSAD